MGKVLRTNIYFHITYIRQSYSNEYIFFLNKQIINQSETAVTFRVDLASQYAQHRLEEENKNVWNATFDSDKYSIGKEK